MSHTHKKFGIVVSARQESVIKEEVAEETEPLRAIIAAQDPTALGGEQMLGCNGQGHRQCGSHITGCQRPAQPLPAGLLANLGTDLWASRSSL